MKSLFNFSALLLLLFIGVSCSSNDDNSSPPAPIIVTFNATLSGASEVPANASTATGTATLSYNKTTKIFTVTVTYSGLTPTMGHIHMGAAGTNGPVIFPFASLASPISYTSTALTAAQETDLLSNNYYVNLHSEAFSGGEIRGQLVTANPAGSPAGGGGGGGGY